MNKFVTPMELRTVRLSDLAVVERVKWLQSGVVDITITISDKVTGYIHTTDVPKDKVDELISLLNGEADGQ